MEVGAAAVAGVAAVVAAAVVGGRGMILLPLFYIPFIPHLDKEPCKTAKRPNPSLPLSQ